MNPRILYISGLPRAGSTLLCQLLGLHPDMDSPGHSSPLWNALNKTRETLSDDPFWLAQLDVDFDRNYARLLHACQGFMTGWFAGTSKPWVVDKNRGWLMAIETLRLLDPDFRMVVCLRDPVQVFGSIEAQHQKTLLLSFPDHIAPPFGIRPRRQAIRAGQRDRRAAQGAREFAGLRPGTPRPFGLRHLRGPTGKPGGHPEHPLGMARPAAPCLRPEPAAGQAPRER
ncbi:hypothetical protein CCP4SC76_4660003 [Gammaproteobacteria bacterium]